jgi:hypothetical protein
MLSEAELGGGIELLRCGDSACGRNELSVCHGGCCDCERGGGAPDPCRLSNPVVLSCWITVAVICDRTSGDR